VFDYQYREHIKPYFGDSVIDKLKPDQFREWQRSLVRKGYKNSYTWTIQSRLRAILNYGVRHGYLSINPFTVSNMRNIDERPKEMSFWTPEEFSRFIHQVKDQTYHAYFMTLFYAGLRKGEAMALTDSDIDFINSTIRVNKNLDYVVVKGDTSPKTFRSYRTVPLHPALRKELHELVLLHRKMSGYADDCYLFGYDTYLKPGKLRKTMIEAISLSGVRFIHIHELRHSYASLLINLGFTPMEVSKRIGDSMKMVSDTYGHLYPSGDELISSKLQKAYEEAEESIERSSGKA